MKNSKIIFLSIIVSLFFIIASYAAWNDKLIITDTVSTGELNVEFSGECISEPMDSETSYEKRYIDCDVKNNSNKIISVSMSNLYPGSGCFVSVRIENKGTIPAVVDSIDVDFNNSDIVLKDSLYVACGFVHYSESNLEIDNDFFISNVTSMKNELNDLLNSIRLEPGEYIKLTIPEDKKSTVKDMFNEFIEPDKDCIAFFLPSLVGDNLEKKAISFNMKMNFKQHN